MQRAMIKRFISFTAPAFEWLVGEAKALGISVSELVRRAVDDYRARQPKR